MIKTSTAVQETIRRLSNTGLTEEQTVKNQILEDYHQVLKNSGYSKPEIRKYTIAAIVGFTRRVVREEQGGVPVHRSQARIKKSTHSKKLTIRQDWYKQKTDKTDNTLKYKPKKWGNKKISTKSMGCMKESPSAPIFVPRTKGGAQAIRIGKKRLQQNPIILS